VLVPNDPSARYCALKCYKQHNGRCVESFHGDNLGDAMKGLTVEDEEKRKMTDILAKYRRAWQKLPASSYGAIYLKRRGTAYGLPRYQHPF